MNIIGLDSCLRKLASLQNITDSKQFESIASDMKNDAKSNVVVKTGATKNSIDAKVDKVNSGIEIKLWAGTPYAKYIEYGSSKMPAKPFLRPAFNRNISKVDNAIREDIRRRIK